MQWYEIILMSLTVGQFLSMIIGGYIFLQKPSERANDRIQKIEDTCPLRHSIVNEKYDFVAKELTLIKENHLAHIEKSLSMINTNIAVILDRQKMRLDKETSKDK